MISTQSWRSSTKLMRSLVLSSGLRSSTSWDKVIMLEEVSLASGPEVVTLLFTDAFPHFVYFESLLVER